MTNAPYTIAPARHAGRRNGKPQMAVHCVSGGSGFANRAHRICQELKGRYSNRERAYIMSPTKAKKFVELFAEQA